MPRALLLCLVVLFAGCDGQRLQEDFADAASRPAEGITRTDEAGRIVSEDEDDWRTAPLFLGKVRVDPAYPNPVSTQFVTIPFVILDFNAIRGGVVLRAFDANRRFIFLDSEEQATQPGSYILSFSPGLLGRKGLHRLYLFDGVGEIISYGDLELQ